MAWVDNGDKPKGASAEKKAFRATARGRVQGVGFRWWVRGAAERHDVRGWVANRADGSVEIFAEGSAADLALFFAEAEKGPPLSRVESFNKRPCAPEGFRDFSVRGW